MRLSDSNFDLVCVNAKLKANNRFKGSGCTVRSDCADYMRLLCAVFRCSVHCVQVHAAVCAYSSIRDRGSASTHGCETVPFWNGCNAAYHVCFTSSYHFLCRMGVLALKSTGTSRHDDAYWSSYLTFVLYILPLPALTFFLFECFL